MSKKSTDAARANGLRAFETLRQQLAIANGLVARAEKAYCAGAISAKDARDKSADTVVENLAHTEYLLVSIETVLRRIPLLLKAETRAARYARSRTAATRSQRDGR